MNTPAEHLKLHPTSASLSNNVRWKKAFLLGTAIFFSFSYFYEGGGWNQNSRVDLVRSIVERHTLRIDAYHENTGDKAHFQGHYYSDKAPGLMLLAVPFAVAVRSALQTLGSNPEAPRAEEIVSYCVTLCAVSLPTALAGVSLFLLGVRLTNNTSAGAFAAVVLSLGTPTWAYASLFWGHALAGACLLFSLSAALKVGDSTTAAQAFRWALVAGLTAGWATVTEYPAAPASAIMAILALARAWKGGPSKRTWTAAGLAIGAGVCVIVLMSYLYAAFGSFRPSYEHYDANSFAFMHRGYLGLTYPHVDVLLKLLFGCRRGLFFAAPAVAAAPVGLYWLARNKSMRPVAIAAGAVAAYYFLFNASFYEWRSGLSFGPRYAGAAIPILCLGLPVFWSRANRFGRTALTLLAGIGILFSLMVISTTSQLSEEISCPLLHSSWPAFWSGQMALNRGSMLTIAETDASLQYGAFNLGQLLGLSGLTSLAPLLAVWAVAAILWIRAGRSRASGSALPSG